jgi:YD repeat-containing protein
VNAATGNKFQREPVYAASTQGALALTLSYNSYNYVTISSNQLTGPYGRNWIGRYTASIRKLPGNATGVRRPDGKDLEFRPPPSGNFYLTDADTPERLESLLNGSTQVGWRYTTADGDEVEIYDMAGRPLSITSRLGLVTRLTYGDGNNGFLYPQSSSDPATAGPLGFRSPACQVPHPAASVGAPVPKGRLLCATDPFGRQAHFQYLAAGAINYDALGRVRRMLDPAGQAYVFEYDGPSGPASANNLTKITFPDNTVRTYHYNEAAQINSGTACPGLPSGLPNALTGITDENGDRFATWSYDCQSRATSSQHALGVDHYAFSYAPGTTTIVDPLGTSRTLAVQPRLGVFKSNGTTQPAASGVGTVSNSNGYDANGNVASRTDFNGNVTHYSYDLTRNLETSRSEAFGTAQARTITTQWHPAFRLPAKVAEPLRITSYVYNGDGGASCGFQADSVTLVPGVSCSKTIQPTTDTTGAAGFAATSAGTPRTWSYTYNVNGSILTIDGPRIDVADVTTYTYYPNNDPDLGKRGNVATITNALGHLTSITAYNGHGQPLTIVDPSGLTTTLTYDTRQRLTSRSVGGELTGYTYDAAGQLTKVTLPDNSSLAYSYDSAHRLIGIADNLGNRITYTLDAMGNRTKEDVFDPASALAQTRRRVFNNLNRLFQEIGAQNQTTQYAYDNQGNLTSIDGALAGTADTTINAYDALNRLKQVTDPNGGVTQYGYNGIDQLVSVTDPRTLATTYNYDGLANLNSQASPDTGTTANTYDAAGNLLTQTDAKGQVTTYTYDALNRVKSITFQDGSKHIYAYDQGTNGIGRLTSITESNALNESLDVINYGYDQHGRVTSVAEVVDNVSTQHSVGYQYDSFGRMAQITYPFSNGVDLGGTANYLFDALGRFGQVSVSYFDRAFTPPAAVTKVVVQNVQYQPFGGVKSFTLGNGQSYTRGYDQDGRIASYNLGAQSFALGYDAASRISFLTDTGNPVNSNTYGYDLLDRLTSTVLPNTPFAYGYDAVGNRSSKTVGSSTDTYAYGTTSNRIASITAQAGAVRNFSFDPNGSTTNDGANQYVYDSRGRLIQSTNGAACLVSKYHVNPLGQRVRKTVTTCNTGAPVADTLYVYDLGGRLLSEHLLGGNYKRAYIYLNDIPVGLVWNQNE